MMDIPAPALLAAIALLVWPAGRIYAVLTTRQGDRFVARHAVGASLLQRLQRAMIAASVLTADFVLFAVMLAGILLLKLAMRRICGSDAPLIFGKVSLNVFFDFAMLAQFVVFIFQGALDSYITLHDKATDVGTASGVAVSHASQLTRLLAGIPKRLRTELAVYASTAAVYTLMFFVAAALVALHGGPPA